VPDACIDVLWNGTQLTVAGPDTAPVTLALPARTQIVGVRFLPGAGGAVLAAPASALCDARLPLAELWGDAARALEDALHAAPDADASARVLERALIERRAQAAAIDPLARALVAWLQPTAAGAPPGVAALAQRAGVSERQLLRRSRAAFGYGPKLLARILRFQAFRSGLRAQPRVQLAQLAQQLGYADQAHLTHEVSELSGVTPTQLKREAMSDFDKTSRPSLPQSTLHEQHR
jgi:AraC-like DNA-binding protein